MSAPDGTGDRNGAKDARYRGPVLHLLVSLGETSFAFNELCLPLSRRAQVSIASFYPAKVDVPDTIRLFEGDGTVRGFLRSLRQAGATGPFAHVHAHSPHVGVLYLLYRALGRGPAGTSVATVHNSYENFKPRNRLLLLPVFRGFDHVVCVGRESLASFPSLYRRLADGRLSAIPNGVNLERVRAVLDDGPIPAERTEFTVASVGRLTAIKDPMSVVRAFADGAPAPSRLVLVGQGELFDQVGRGGEHLSDGQTLELTGVIARDDVYRLLQRADLFVSASYGEGLPVAVLEAMACGVPVVLSDIPPHREVAGGVDYVPLVPPGDVAGFAREIERVRRMTPTQRREVGERCRELVETSFSLTHMLAQYEALYRSGGVQGAP